MLTIQLNQNQIQSQPLTWYESSVDPRYHAAIAEAERWAFDWRQTDSSVFMIKAVASALSLLVPIFAFNRQGKTHLQVAWESLGEAEDMRARLFHHIQRNGLIAPFLRTEWAEYRDLVGMYRAMAEIQFAYRMNFPMATKPLALATDKAFEDPDNWYLWDEYEIALLPQLKPHWQTPLLAPAVEPNPVRQITLPTLALASSSQPQVEVERQGKDPGIDTPQTGKQLIRRLESECPELLLLVKAPPIRLVGLQRTGKSTFARKLALLRAIALPGHKLAWATPHREADNPLPDLLNPFGTKPTGAKDMGTIERTWKDVSMTIDHGRQLNSTFVWDEFGSYDQFEDTDSLGKSLKSMLREATKHGYHPILIAHGDQAGFYPGITGILTTLKGSTVKVETIGKPVDLFGTMKPTGEVKVTWLDGKESTLTVPLWLTESLLLSLLINRDTKPEFIASSHKAEKPQESGLIENGVNNSKVSPPIYLDLGSEQKTHTGSDIKDDPFNDDLLDCWDAYTAIEDHKPTDIDTRNQLVKENILKNLSKKIKALKGEWINCNDLLKSSVAKENRDSAKAYILELSMHGFEFKDEVNKNKSVSKFVRFKPDQSVKSSIYS